MNDASGGFGHVVHRDVAEARTMVVSVRALAADGDADFVVHRAPSPPQTAGARFRAASAPLARTLRRLVHEAGGERAGGTAGADLAGALDQLRALAESYDIQPAVVFCANRREAAASLDPRTLAAVDAAAAGLLAEGPSADAPAPAPADPAFRPATGEALVALLATGISGLERFDGSGDAAPAAAPNGAGRAVAAAPNGEGAGPVPIETLLYRGRAALDRARAVRDLLRGRPGAPDPARLDELYDLLDLAALP